jgi:hypothetical protein
MPQLPTIWSPPMVVEMIPQSFARLAVLSMIEFSYSLNS